MIKIAICDDNIDIVNELKGIILNYEKMNCYKFDIKIFNSGKELENKVKNEIFDIIFLDVELDGVLGIDIGSKLREDMNNYFTKIIYVSSYQHYAMSAYNSMPTDFITKPFKIEKVEKSISNVLKLLNFVNKDFVYNSNGKINKVLLSNITYFESYRNIVKIFTIYGKEDKFYSSLKQVINNINSKMFIQQHKSFIVNIEYISKIEKNSIILVNNQEIPISRDKIKYVKQMILKYERHL